VERFCPVQPLSDGHGAALAAGAATADATGLGDAGRLVAGRTGGLVVACDAQPARENPINPPATTTLLNLLTLLT
jgi:hypothetical protein